MNTETTSRVHETLLSRRHAIADDWYKAIAQTSFAPRGAAELHQHLVELTEQAITVLLGEPFERSQAEAIGVSLAALHYVEPDALSRTQEVLGQQLVEGLPVEQVVALQPRLAALLGGVAAGFFQQVRETIISEQERIRSALIGELQRAEEVLRESEKTARALLNAPTDSAVLTDPEGTIIAINETGTRRLGKSEDELVGMCIFDFFPPDKAEFRKARVDEVIRLAEPIRFEDEHQGRVLDTCIYPVLSAQGKVERLAIYARDITERKRAEEELIRLSSAVKASVDSIVIMDVEGKVIDVNESALRMYGADDKGDLIGQRVLDLIAPEHREKALAGIEFVLEEGYDKSANL
jgi:PAS domain S-box-containing protein